MASTIDHRAAYHRAIVRDILAEPEHAYFHSAGVGFLASRGGAEFFYAPTSASSSFDYYSRPSSGGIPGGGDPFRGFDCPEPALLVAEASAVFDGAEAQEFSFEHITPRFTGSRIGSSGLGPVLRAGGGSGKILATAELPGVAHERLSLSLVGARFLKLSVEYASDVPAVSMLRLRRDVTHSDIEADFVDGVLRVSLVEGATAAADHMLSETTAKLKAEQEQRVARIADVEEELRTLRREARDAEGVLRSAIAEERRAMEERTAPIAISAAQACLATESDNSKETGAQGAASSTQDRATALAATEEQVAVAYFATEEAGAVDEGMEGSAQFSDCDA